MKIKYKNVGIVTKTFYGVEFKPGETKEVSGYINAKSFIRIDEKNTASSKNSKAANISSTVPKTPQVVDTRSDPKPADLKPAEPRPSDPKAPTADTASPKSADKKDAPGKPAETK